MASIRSHTGLRAVTLLYLASLTTALPALGDFKYQGCYTNDDDDAALKGKVVTDESLTLPKCAVACDGYPWFGVQAGSVCYCGTSLAESAVKRPDTECKERCAGNHCQVCGGPDRINIFWAGKGVTTSASAEPTSTGTEEPPVESTSTQEPSASTSSIEEPPVDLNDPNLRYPVYSMTASRCSTALLGPDLTLPTSLSGCFSGYNRPNWTPTAAYSCLATADLTCRSTTVCKDAVATPTAPAEHYRNALFVEGETAGFEDGKLWDLPFGTNSGESVIRVGVDQGVVHEGRHALKVDFLNTNGGSRGWAKYITLDPGAEYVVAGGVNFVKDAGTKGGPTRQWVKVEHRFTTLASFGRAFFSVYGNMEAAANTFYVDDISITRV
ncbi:hypothetical protein N0V88_005856 [Collariella sp. IMI 366227]|nr:hypothetical protein N0V88_005856 [Collariella sp. IMI 366227]